MIHWDPSPLGSGASLYQFTTLVLLCLGLYKTVEILRFSCILILDVSMKIIAVGFNGLVLFGIWTCQSSINGLKLTSLEKYWAQKATLLVPLQAQFVLLVIPTLQDMALKYLVARA